MMSNTTKEHSYSQYNFRISWQPGSGKEGESIGKEDVLAGFQEVSGLSSEISIAVYRAGNNKKIAPRKISDTSNTTNITFKRGVMAKHDLYKWVDESSNGVMQQLKNINIKLMSEDRLSVAQEWVLKHVRLMKHTGPSLNAKGADLAIEELVVSVEQIEILIDKT